MTSTLTRPADGWIQASVAKMANWTATRFGAEVLASRRERAARVLEEAIELAQAEGLSIAKCERILEVVYSKPVGDPSQEAAGVGTTLLAWAAATGVDLQATIQAEINRIHSLPVDHFRKKGIEKKALGVTGDEEPVHATCDAGPVPS